MQLPRLPLTDEKLHNVPYVQLLTFAVEQALEDKRFTKEQAISAYPKLAARWEQLAPTILSADEDGTYLIKAEAFLEYVNLVSLQDSRRHAQRAYLIALAALTVSTLILLARFFI